MPEHEHWQNNGTPQYSGRTTKQSGVPVEYPTISTEHQWNTPEQQYHAKQKAIIVLLKEI